MSKWKQVNGDTNWSSHGGTFARDDGRGVDLVKITPWAELDSSAIPQYGLYNVQSDYIDYDDLNEGILPGALSKRIKDSLSYVGMSEEEYAKLAPIYKADVYMEGHSWNDDRSTSDLLSALPDSPENIEFYHGKETEKSVREDNAEARREAVQEHFESSMSFGEMPDDELLDFALGDEDFTMELKGSDAKAFDYAMWMAGVKLYSASTSLDKDDFKTAIQALADAPSGDGLEGAALEKAAEGLGLDPEEDVEDIREQADKLSEEAQSLASSMLDVLGIEWI